MLDCIPTMERYEVLSIAGEGSFGRVYKARCKETNDVVAFKVIQKRGRPEKELDSLRCECDIQRQLHHPNIIQMLDAFETENEIVVVSEFADRQLFELLGKSGYLPEQRVQQITCDLVAALFYLHSNRVLHRDLKPQNVLLSADGTAKLCDFGFARSMTTGTMLLTSIKGTPLYMAPELVTESPYDHNADLWSLGCIVYELLVGTPPFSTSSILHLVRLIRHEPIKFPDFVSANCVSFLQGLLQKEPSKRLSWPQLLKHPFLEGKVVVPEDQAGVIPSFTHPLSDSQQKAKETQRQQLTEKLSAHSRVMPYTIQLLQEYEKQKQPKSSIHQHTVPPTCCTSFKKDKDAQTNVSDSRAEAKQVLSQSPHASKQHCKKSQAKCAASDSDESAEENEPQVPTDLNVAQNDEWLDYLHRSMEEVMTGDLSCLIKAPLVAVATAPLTRRSASPNVIEYVACLLSLPLVIGDIPGETLDSLLETYLESRIIDQIMKGLKVLICNRTTDQLLPASALRTDQVLALERMCLLLNHLVHRQPAEVAAAFTKQLCDNLTDHSAHPGVLVSMRHLLGMGKRKGTVVADVLAVVAQMVRVQPANAKFILQTVLLGPPAVNVLSILGHSLPVVRTRCCVVLRMLAQHCKDPFQALWVPSLAERLQTLQQDDDRCVQQAAACALHELSKLPFFPQQSGITG